MVKNGCGQSGHGAKKSFHAGTNSGKLTVDSFIFGWAWSEIAMAF